MYFRSVTLTLVALAASATPSLAQGYYGGDAAPPSSASAIAPSAAPTAAYDYGNPPAGAIPTVTGVLPPPTATMYPGYGGNDNSARAPGGHMKVVVTHNGQEYTVTVPGVPGLTDIPCCGERDGVDPSDKDAEGTFCRQLRAELTKVPACTSLAAAGAIEADLIEDDEAAPPATGASGAEARPAVQPSGDSTSGYSGEKKPEEANSAGGNGQQVQAASASSGVSHFQVSGAKLLRTVGAGLVVAGAVIAM